MTPPHEPTDPSEDGQGTDAPSGIRRRWVGFAIAGVLLGVGLVVGLGVLVFGGSSSAELESAEQFHEVLANEGVHCEFWEGLAVDDEYGESLYPMASFDGTVTDAGACSIDEGDLVDEAGYRYGDIPSSFRTDVYVFDSADNADHYSSLMKTSGCGGEGESYAIVHARSWIAVLDFDASQDLADALAAKFGAEGTRISC